MDIALPILFTLALTIANGFFVMSEMALSTAKQAVLEHEAEEGDERAKVALELASDSSTFLAATQIGMTMLGFFASAFAATSLSGPFGDWLGKWGIPASRTVATVIITLCVSYFTIVVGEVVPKRMALADAEEKAKSVAGFVRGFSRVAKPLLWLTNISANGLSNALGIGNADDRQAVTEEEIQYLVNDAEELTDEEKSMINEVIELGDTTAREVMCPRVDLVAVEDNETCIDVLDVMRRTGFSRIPVFHEDVDRIVGIAHIKDLIAPIIDNDERETPISEHLRKATFVPETKDIIPLLAEMRAAREQMAIVVDEYGGTAGVVTVEDIVEEIVGEIADEFDPDNKYLTQLSDREWLVDGRFSIDDARELGWPIDETDEYETVAGFVLEMADRLPKPGDVVDIDGFSFLVQSMRGRRVSLLRVTAPVAEAQAE